MQPNRPQTPRMKVLFVQDQNYQIDHQFDSVPCLPDAHTFYEDQTQNESQVHEENEHFGDYSEFQHYSENLLLENDQQIPTNLNISCNYIPISKIQQVLFYVNGQTAILSLDSGCEGDCICESECYRLNIPIMPLDSSDSQPTLGDEQSMLNLVGKAQFYCVRDKITLFFDGYVTKTLQAPILCGGSFLSRNKITQELHNSKIVIAGKYHIMEHTHYSPQSVQNVHISQVIQENHPEEYFDFVPPSPENERSIEKPHTPIPEKGLYNFDSDKAFLKTIYIEDDVPKKLKENLNAIHIKHQKVFNSDLTGGYNGFSGNFDVDFEFLNDVRQWPLIIVHVFSDIETSDWRRQEDGRISSNDA